LKFCEILEINSLRTLLQICPKYKNQQREIEFQMKKQGLLDETNYNVLTIDQCQGQESDIVILSLVQKPTRFMTKNRWNVALSRVRKQLFVLGDRNALANVPQSREDSRIISDIVRVS